MAMTAHEQLFGEYVEALEWAIREAEQQREKDRERLEERYEEDHARVAEVFETYGGLYADPYVIGAVRMYWLKCDLLNRTFPARAVPPAVFILDWLRNTQKNLAAVVAAFPYWPVGQDETGGWV